MKTIKEILEIVKEELDWFVGRGYERTGLCIRASRAYSRNRITSEEFLVFKRYLEEETGVSYGFVWRLGDNSSRFEWLDKQIKLNS